MSNTTTSAEALKRLRRYAYFSRPYDAGTETANPYADCPGQLSIDLFAALDQGEVSAVNAGLLEALRALAAELNEQWMHVDCGDGTCALQERLNEADRLISAYDQAAIAAAQADPAAVEEEVNHAPKDWPQPPGAWKDQSLSRLDRVRAHRVEFNSDLRTAVNAVDSETQRVNLEASLERAYPAPLPAPGASWTANVRAVLRAAGDFIEEEADNRANAGSEMSDYEREPRELCERIDAALTSLNAAPAAGGGADELIRRLTWALDRLDECGGQVEFTLGTCRSIADCRAFLAAMNAAPSAGVQLDRIFVGGGEYVRADEAVRQIMALQAKLSELSAPPAQDQPKGAGE